jgi:hypothetical protein
MGYVFLRRTEGWICLRGDGGIVLGRCGDVLRVKTVLTALSNYRGKLP